MGRIYRTEDPTKVRRSQNMNWKTNDRKMKNGPGISLRILEELFQ